VTNWHKTELKDATVKIFMDGQALTIDYSIWWINSNEVKKHLALTDFSSLLKMDTNWSSI
jgi:hypothetical protein